jgi:hypothetical protein
MRVAASSGLLAAALLVWSVGSDAQQSNCQVTRKDFVSGGMSAATMDIRGAQPCRFVFRFGKQNAPDSWELIQPPKSGKVSFGTDFAEYAPDSGFVGEDKFIVNLFGKSPQCNKPGGRCNRTGRYEITVTVRPPS